jgi:glucose uptake protein GlcU
MPRKFQVITNFLSGRFWGAGQYHENPFKYFTNVSAGKEMIETPDKN